MADVINFFCEKARMNKGDYSYLQLMFWNPLVKSSLLTIGGIVIKIRRMKFVLRTSQDDLTIFSRICKTHYKQWQKTCEEE